MLGSFGKSRYAHLLIIPERFDVDLGVTFVTHQTLLVLYVFKECLDPFKTQWILFTSIYWMSLISFYTVTGVIKLNIHAFLQVIVSFSNFTHYTHNNRDILDNQNLHI